MGLFQHIIPIFVALLVVFVLYLTPISQWLTERNLDIFFHLRGSLETSQSVVIVGIDEQSLEQLGPWPFPRQFHGEVLNRLQKARAVGFDLLFDGNTDNDLVFLQSIQSGPPISFAVARDYRGLILTPPWPIRSNVKLGHIETLLGTDGVARTVKLVQNEYQVLAMAMLASGQVKEADQESTGIRLINYYGPEFTFLYLSYLDILKGVYPTDFFQDRYVLVGSQALALGDVHVTPFSKKFPTPGVEVQATILNNLLENSFLVELKKLGFGLSVSIVILGSWFWAIHSEIKNLFSCLLSIFFVTVISFQLFKFNLFLNLTLPLLTLLVGYAVHLMSKWLIISLRLIRVIRCLDQSLQQGVNTIFQNPPELFKNVSLGKERISYVTGIEEHLLKIEEGIIGLGLQTSFINHLLSHETPPIILWSKKPGKVVIVNDGFVGLWSDKLGQKTELPTLCEFSVILQTNMLNKQPDSLTEFLMEEVEKEEICDIALEQRGKKYHYRVMIHPVKNEEAGFSGVLAGITDVTEIRELERIKSEVMNIVSHELKLPLTTILGFAEMLSESSRGNEKKYAEEIKSQAVRLGKMIEDFLDLSRIENGKYTINQFPIDLRSIIYDAAGALQYAADEKKIRLEYDIPTKVSPMIGDELLLVQVVLNILENALKFSPTGTVVSLLLTEEMTTFRISVSDQGVGISDQDKDRIFEKFIRGQKKNSSEGFGLGLSFVKQVVEAHGGEVRAQNAQSGGALFTLILPKK